MASACPKCGYTFGPGDKDEAIEELRQAKNRLAEVRRSLAGLTCTPG